MTETAPLVSIPQAPVPDGGAAEWFEARDGLKLRAALFPAKGAARGSVVLSPVPHNKTVAGVPARVVGESGCDQPSRQMDQLLPSQSMDQVISFDI